MDLLRNIQYLKSWLSRRVLSLSRANAKQIYTMYQIPQLDDIETRVKICLACKGVVTRSTNISLMKFTRCVYT